MKEWWQAMSDTGTRVNMKHGESAGRLPDFLVIGAQKSGTTTIFALLRQHHDIYLPLQKEVHFFDLDEQYQKGLEWYRDANFSIAGFNGLVGEVTPGYMRNRLVAQRIKMALPDAKLIAILRHPLRRAFSHYQMSVRRGLEKLDFSAALMASQQSFAEGKELAGSAEYYRFSNYSEVLDEYLMLFPREKLLILFQEELEQEPLAVTRKIHEFLELNPIDPHKSNIRLHQAGRIKYPWLQHMLKSKSTMRSFLKRILPWRLRAAIKFWIEQYNIKKSAPQSVPDEVLRDYNWVVREQKVFLKERFGIDAPWQEWQD